MTAECSEIRYTQNHKRQTLFISDTIGKCVKCQRELEASEGPAELCEECVTEDQKLRVICIES